MNEQSFRVWCNYHLAYEEHDIKINMGGFQFENDRPISGHGHTVEPWIWSHDVNRKPIFVGDTITNVSGKTWTVVIDKPGARFALQESDECGGGLMGITQEWLIMSKARVIGTAHDKWIIGKDGEDA